jgi:hypothetical protein
MPIGYQSKVVGLLAASPGGFCKGRQRLGLLFLTRFVD